MGNNKEAKKGFWAGLFTRKPKCACGDSISPEDEGKEVSGCDCGGGIADMPAPVCGCSPAESVAREVIVLGPGCVRCKETYDVVRRVIAENHLAARLSKIEDIAEIMNYNIIKTPAVVVDGTVRIKGHVPSVDEVKKAMGI